MLILPINCLVKPTDAPSSRANPSTAAQYMSREVRLRAAKQSHATHAAAAQRERCSAPLFPLPRAQRVHHAACRHSRRSSMGRRCRAGTTVCRFDEATELSGEGARCAPHDLALGARRAR